MTLTNPTAWEMKADHLVKATTSALWNAPQFPFCVGGQVRLMKAGYKPQKAWETTVRCLSDFLKDEGVSFGNPRYSWGMDDGAQIVEEYELRG